MGSALNCEWLCIKSQFVHRAVWSRVRALPERAVVTPASVAVRWRDCY